MAVLNIDNNIPVDTECPDSLGDSSVFTIGGVRRGQCTLLAYLNDQMSAANALDINPATAGNRVDIESRRQRIQRAYSLCLHCATGQAVRNIIE